MRGRTMRWMVCVLALMLVAGCSADEQPAQTTIKVSVYGWGPKTDGSGEDGFVTGMPNYADAAAVITKLTKPDERRVDDVLTTPISDRAVSFPEVDFGEGWRLDFEVINAAAEVVAHGSTDVFDVDRGAPGRALRLMVAPRNGFAPAGSVVQDRTTGMRKYTQSRFDYRSLDRESEDPFWLGRVGHTAATTTDGKVLVVGGADVIPGYTLGAVPQFRQVFSDVQIFDPATGYFSDLSFDEATGAPLPNNGDRLSEARAFHTLTPLGNDRYLVVGGFTSRNSVTRPVNTIDVIDLNKEPGQRVRQLIDPAGVGILLEDARGYHTASVAGQTIVITGGIGRDGDDDFLDSVELIDLQRLEVIAAGAALSVPRAQHEAVVLGDDQTVWVLGGRNNDGSMATTEVIKLGATVTVSPEAEMKEPRFNFEAVRVSTDAGLRKVLVIGGYTDTDGGVTANVELGEVGRGEFIRRDAWKLETGRGGLTAVELRQSQDIVVIGGADGSGVTVSAAERLEFRGFTEADPYVALGEIGQAHVSRYLGEATYMATGQILITGGIGKAQNTVVGLDTAELFNAYDPVGVAALGP